MARPTIDPESPAGKRLEGVPHNVTPELFLLAGIYDELVTAREGTPEAKRLLEESERLAAGKPLTPETAEQAAAELMASAAGMKIKQPRADRKAAKG